MKPVAILLAFAAVSLTAQQTVPTKTNLRVGDTAPDFTLTDTAGKKVTLSSFRGKPVVLAFFPAAFTGG